MATGPACHLLGELEPGGTGGAGRGGRGLSKGHGATSLDLDLGSGRRSALLRRDNGKEASQRRDGMARRASSEVADVFSISTDGRT